MLLVVAGGLNYAYSINLVTVITLEVLVTILFTLICLFCKQDTQLKVAKWLTFFFSIVMSVVTVGLIKQVGLTNPKPVWHKSVNIAILMNEKERKRTKVIMNLLSCILLLERGQLLQISASTDFHYSCPNSTIPYPFTANCVTSLCNGLPKKRHSRCRNSDKSTVTSNVVPHIYGCYLYLDCPTSWIGVH